MSAFVGELSRSLRMRAKQRFGLGSVQDAFTGALAAVQRTDGAVRLNVHLHVLALDGVYVRDGATGQLTFRQLPTPTHAEIAQVARRTADRLEQLVRPHGRSLNPQLSQDAPPLGSVLNCPRRPSAYSPLLGPGLALAWHRIRPRRGDSWKPSLHTSGGRLNGRLS